MAGIQPRPREAAAELEGVFSAAEAAMGFVPNSMLTMAHMPQLPMAFLMLTGVAFGGDLRDLVGRFADRVPHPGDQTENLPPALVQMLAFAVSLSAGCRYCQAHTSHSAHRLGETNERLAAILDYESSPVFTEAERAALALAFAAGAVPNEVTDAHFEALQGHYSERQVTQIVAIVSMFGFLNRWNDTMGTTLEALPLGFAGDALQGWSAGKHAP